MAEVGVTGEVVRLVSIVAGDAVVDEEGPHLQPQLNDLIPPKKAVDGSTVTLGRAPLRLPRYVTPKCYLVVGR